jgi:predicted nucleic acid-binding protein
MYLDTSVVVKLYTREPDSARCEQAVAGHKLVSSELLYAELWSALLAKERAGVLTPELRFEIWQLFELHVREDVIELMSLNGLVIRAAAEITARTHPFVALRTLDAIHLATFSQIIAGPLFSTDAQMNAAARRLGYPLAG